MNNARITAQNNDEDAFYREFEEALANIDLNGLGEFIAGLGFADRFIGEHKFVDKASFTDDEVEQYLKDQVTQELDLARYDITYSAALTNKTAHLLAAREDIQSLNIEDNDLNDEGIELLASIPNLTALEIGGNYLTDACTQALKTNTKLQRLGLRAAYAYKDYGYQSGAITENGADNLSQNESIRSLNLSGQPIGDNGAIKLASNKHLHSLELESCGITDIGAMSFANSENLTALNLAGNSSVSDVSIVALGANSHLTSLNLNDCNITDQGAQQLLTNTSLTTLNIDCRPISELCRISLEEHVRLNKINKVLNTSSESIKRQFNWGNEFNFFNSYRQQPEKESFASDIEIMFNEDDYINNTI
jgi:hypothetical protein